VVDDDLAVALVAAPVVNGTADPPTAVVYWAPSSRKP
jgi:hypothetical protein